MGTVVTIHIIGKAAERESGAARAAAWFHEIEARCTRFAPASELMQLSAHIGERVVASPLLFQAVQFALAVAEETEGAFDPTVGLKMESLGFNREHRSGSVVRTPLESARAVSYRDVELDVDAQSITVTRPLVLDLGAVAKGLAIDTAAREL